LPWAPLQNLPEVCNDPQALANDFFVEYDSPAYGKVKGVANPIHFSKTKADQRMPCPEFSQHTEEVLLENGYTWDDIIKFKDEGAIA
jgi:crotonobetainyl-CoA:carnitine CoA-transferase CaiB-like acyl-CoA transferase